MSTLPTNHSAGSEPDPGPDRPHTPVPDFLEDEQLAAVAADIEQFADEAGWDSPARLFAIVDTATLLASQPSLRGTIDPDARWTPIVQDPLPSGSGEHTVERALATISWPDEVDGCALVQEIVVLPPDAAAQLPPDSSAADLAADHPDRTDARLVVAVLRGQPGGACRLRIRGSDADPLRGADLAPGVINALHATFD